MSDETKQDGCDPAFCSGSHHYLHIVPKLYRNSVLYYRVESTPGCKLYRVMKNMENINTRSASYCYFYFSQKQFKQVLVALKLLGAEVNGY